MSTQTIEQLRGPSMALLYHVDNEQPVLSVNYGTDRSDRHLEIVQSLLKEALKTSQPVMQFADTTEDEFWLAIPYVAAEQLRSILILCYDRKQLQSTAVEIWNLMEGRAELRLREGFYSGLEHFKEISAEVNFAIGVGLPGTTWSKARPRFLKPLGTSVEFVRATEALVAGLETGVGIPIFNKQSEIEAVLLLLFSADIHMASGLQIWSQNSAGDITCEELLHSHEDPVSLSAIHREELLAYIGRKVRQGLDEQRMTLSVVPSQWVEVPTQVVTLPVPSRFGAPSTLVLLFS